MQLIQVNARFGDKTLVAWGMFGGLVLGFAPFILSASAPNERLETERLSSPSPSQKTPPELSVISSSRRPGLPVSTPSAPRPLHAPPSPPPPPTGEAARAVRDWVRRERGVERLISLIVPSNSASRGVAERLGAVPTETVVLHGTDAAVVWVHPSDAAPAGTARD